MRWLLGTRTFDPFTSKLFFPPRYIVSSLLLQICYTHVYNTAPIHLKVTYELPADAASAQCSWGGTGMKQ